MTSVHGRASAPSKVKCKHNASFHVVEKSIAYNARKMHDMSCESGDNARNFSRDAGFALSCFWMVVVVVVVVRSTGRTLSSGFDVLENIVKFASLFFQLSFA